MVQNYVLQVVVWFVNRRPRSTVCLMVFTLPLAVLNQKQLSNYLHRRAVPRQKQADRIMRGLHRFAREILSITL